MSDLWLGIGIGVLCAAPLALIAGCLTSEAVCRKLRDEALENLHGTQALFDELKAAAPITCPHCGRLTTQQSEWSEADDAAENVAMLRRRPPTDRAA